ncbi:ISL3 family transposase [Alicyclobacillus fastidiosus]|uniref:ISL3 family transposase n=1 Tax=Alicyclobacillus fastidiosus TaxID=392011 RepID=A0ABY6ZKJ7_9BACL|nr:ISL3 family transposase [Alicyclobacillus fastidiosus]WAH43113.1 ISL3 family transposase [Alicyclobacillus fastidiosus]
MDKLLSSVFPELTGSHGYFTSSLVVLHLSSTSSGNHCPDCGHWTSRVHSHYHRTVEDIPMCDIQVVLRVRARKFFCTNPHCHRRISSERFPGFLESSQRKTTRLNRIMTQIGFSLGGNPGVALCQRLGFSVSKDTLLRRVQEKSVKADDEDISVVGIDDWAYKRGQRYGTIIVDLQHHRLLDLLPDRSVSSVADWLRTHPGIRIVSRDRAGIYADAIRQGLPSAKQIADRWHILKNLGDAVERFVSRQRLPTRDHVEDLDPVERAQESTKPSHQEQDKLKRRQMKWDLVQRVQHLRENGPGIRAIAREAGLSRKTIRKYLSWTELPVTR